MFGVRLFTGENPNFVVYMEYIFGVCHGWLHWRRTPSGESYAAGLSDVQGRVFFFVEWFSAARKVPNSARIPESQNLSARRSTLGHL